MTTILAVDDSPSIRELVRMTLQDKGYQVVTANDGLEGLAAATSQKVDLIVTDVNMPNMNGLDFIKALRAKGRFTPVLVLTTESNAEMKSLARAAGATGWLVKPFNPASLLDTIKKVVP